MIEYLCCLVACGVCVFFFVYYHVDCVYRLLLSGLTSVQAGAC